MYLSAAVTQDDCTSTNLTKLSKTKLSQHKLLQAARLILVKLAEKKILNNNYITSTRISHRAFNITTRTAGSSALYVSISALEKNEEPYKHS